MKEPKQRKPHLKQPIDRSVAWIKKNKTFLIAGVVIIAIFIAALFITASCTERDSKRRADQAEKRLNELIDQHEQDEIKWQTEKSIEIEKAIEDARARAQAEMAEQMAILNKRLEEEIVAYEELKKSFESLMETYNQLMETVFGPTSFLPGTEPLKFSQQFASAAIVDGKYCFIDNVDEYLNWKYVASPQSYQHLINCGRILVQGGELTGTATDAFKEAAIIAYDGYRFDGVFEMWGRTRSPYYGHGVEVVKYLRSRGRDWYTAIVIMEFESTCALDPLARNDFGVCDSSIDMSWDLKGYCDYLDKWQMKTFNCLSNDFYKIMQVYNDYTDYRNRFYAAAGSLKNWYP